MAEAHVLNIITQHNKPFAVQGVVDFLQTQGIKKTAVQKALDALVESGKIIMKVSTLAVLNASAELQRSYKRPRQWCQPGLTVSMNLTGVWESQDLRATSDRQSSALERGKPSLVLQWQGSCKDLNFAWKVVTTCSPYRQLHG